MNLPKRLLIVASFLLVGSALLSGVLVASSANLFSSDEKSSLTYEDPKGTPVPAQTSSTAADEWTVVPPEQRTDVKMIDVTDATIAVPDTEDAADCESGDLDPAKTEEAIRSWFDTHRDDLARTSVWDGTIILVTCGYPDEQFDGQLALYVGIPQDGYSYVAPDSCADKARDLPPDAQLPGECILPSGLDTPLELDRYTIVVDPEEVLQ